MPMSAAAGVNEQVIVFVLLWKYESVHGYWKLIAAAFRKRTKYFESAREPIAVIVSGTPTLGPGLTVRLRILSRSKQVPYESLALQR
jgi:hypothetical protein